MRHDTIIDRNPKRYTAYGAYRSKEDLIDWPVVKEFYRWFHVPVDESHVCRQSDSRELTHIADGKCYAWGVIAVVHFVSGKPVKVYKGVEYDKNLHLLQVKGIDFLNLISILVII